MTTPLYPIEDFFKNCAQTDLQLSPDGLHLSYLAPVNGRMNIFIRPTRGGEARQLTFEKQQDIMGYYWANNQRLLFFKDHEGDENYHLYGIQVDGSDLRCYTPFEGVRVGIIDSLDDCEDELIISMNQRNPEVFDPYRLRLSDGSLTLLAENPGNWQGWLTDHNGVLRAAVAIVDGVNTQLLYRHTDHEPFRPVLTTGFKDTVSFLMFAPDNQYVYAATNLGRDKMVLTLMDPDTCQEIEVLYEHEKYDISNISYSKKRKKLLGVFCVGHRDPIRHYFDEEERTFKEKIRGFFPEQRCYVADNDKAEENFLLYVGDDTHRGSYYFYHLGDDAPQLLLDTAPHLDPQHLSPMLPFCYTTQDGFEIEAFLSLPAHCDPKQPERLPLVVNPHGGPWARDYWGYSSEVQFLCNRGYAVLRMNFRGSTGYGKKFLQASYKEWGKKMQQDITDGVHHLIEKGWADPQRIAIYGGSYGGYATLAGLTFTPELYRCGVDYCGVSNLFTFMKTIPPYWRPMLEMMYEQVGDPEKDAALLDAASPALHADRIIAPLFIAQGANDPRVNKAESDQMVAALRARGVAVDYMVKEDEGHGFAKEENRIDFYQAMERFLAQHL